MRLLLLKTTINRGLKKERGGEKRKLLFLLNEKYDYCDHQNMKMHLVLYYSNPKRKTQWDQIFAKNAKSL